MEFKDRGFVKWQPFASVATPSSILNYIESSKIEEKPILFPELLEELSNKICEAYYSKSIIEIEFYEKGHKKKMNSKVVRLIPECNLIELENKKRINFNQIITIL